MGSETLSAHPHYLGSVSTEQNPRNLKWVGLTLFRCGQKDCCYEWQIFKYRIGFQVYFFRFILKQIYFKCSPAFFSSMHPCIEWRVDVFRSINDLKNLSLMEKGHHDLTGSRQCRHAIILVLGREI